MAYLKSALKSALFPVRRAGARFFNLDENRQNSIIYKAAQIISAELVEGDYLEFGVFRGASLIRSFHTMKELYHRRSLDPIHSPEYHRQVLALWKKMRFFAFDSFSGLPASTGLDRQSKDFSECDFDCGISAFYGELRRHRVDLAKVVAIEGWFEKTCQEETIKQHGIKAASIVHIDCDLYESTKLVLKFIEPLLVDGTVLIFDDWYCFRGNPDLGEQRAFAEWTKGLPNWRFSEYQKEGEWRNSFIASQLYVPRG
ncbi:MAG: TylF/MycF/NovP-related O-methyltransferase [Terriglobia bacterium]